jgi:hypothetical protein
MRCPRFEFLLLFLAPPTHPADGYLEPASLGYHKDYAKIVSGYIKSECGK